MAEESNKVAANNRVLRLNNDYTNQQLAKEKMSAQGPQRKYLGLFLIAVVVIMAIPTYGLIRSYHTLQQVKATETKVTSQSQAVKYQASSQAALIKNMHNNYYIQKFARGNYGYSKNGEKIFTLPSSGSTTETKAGNAN